jgi:N6-adenosine-specific RNA methylase IME4
MTERLSDLIDQAEAGMLTVTVTDSGSILQELGIESPDISLAPLTPQEAELSWLAEHINLQHRLCQDAYEQAVYAARDAGRLLIEAKAKCGHGNWLNWLDANFEGSHDTARNYIRLASNWGQIEEKSNYDRDRNLEPLSIRAALRLLVAEPEVVEGELVEDEPPAPAKTPPQPKAPPPLPRGTYGCVVVDPPWEYKLRANDDTHRNRIPYASMSQDELLALPVPELCPQGVLWLWATNNHMPDAVQLLEHWGFSLKTILTWVKVARNGETRMGTGHWLRAATEHCLLAIRGPVPSFAHAQVLKDQTTILFAERREHSRKPDGFYTMVESLCPTHRLEMFARQQRPGWEVWGDQTDFFEDETDEAI